MLIEEERAILDFEGAHWAQPGPKDEAIERSLGLTAAEYYERLLILVASPAARVYDPLTTKRVLALIEAPARSGLAV
jgi:hypothetical protein